MVDFLYIAGTVAFFALMSGYVAFCARLGRSSEADVAVDEARA
jgi:hypothetical protein